MENYVKQRKASDRIQLAFDSQNTGKRDKKALFTANREKGEIGSEGHGNFNN